MTHSRISKMEEELKCSVCLDFFKSPVRITSCGHNYCQECLTGLEPIPWLCPECRTEQEQSPEQLIRNLFLERSVENFVESRKKICVVHDLPKKLCKYRENLITLGHGDPIETSNTTTQVHLVTLIILSQLVLGIKFRVDTLFVAYN